MPRNSVSYANDSGTPPKGGLAKISVVCFKLALWYARRAAPQKQRLLLIPHELENLRSFNPERKLFRRNFIQSRVGIYCLRLKGDEVSNFELFHQRQILKVEFTELDV